MARINLGSQPNVYPVPVFIVGTYNEDGSANAMTVAWAGISLEDEISLCIGPDRKTAQNFVRTGAFTVSIGDVAHMTECDFLGIVSGNKVNSKVEKAGLTVTKSEFVDAPVINEFGLCLECKLRSYDPSPNAFRVVGEIVNVSVDESCMTNGKVDPEKIRPITYDPFNHTYIALGEKVGIAYQEGKKLL